MLQTQGKIMKYVFFTLHRMTPEQMKMNPDMIYIKSQVFRLLRYYSPAPSNIARSDWVTQKHHTQHDVINSTALWASFTLIMLHS